jgi:protein-S-isoprenylcysteine O-methyltransferase
MKFCLYDPPTLVMIYFLSESLVLRYKRKDDYSVSHDQGSKRLLILVFLFSLGLARLTKLVFPQAQMDILLQLATVGIGLFFAGVGLRWYAIIQLGRFFTTEVAIAADHKLIDTGPYRFVRHPSYSGLLLQFLGIGICSGNILVLVALILPITVARLHRIRIEEAALAEALGSDYAQYMRNTKRIIPFLY